MTDYGLPNLDYDAALSDVNNHQFINVHCEQKYEPEHVTDDANNIIHDWDWVIIGYAETIGGDRPKYVIRSDHFTDIIEEYGADNLLTETMEIMDGKKFKEVSK